MARTDRMARTARPVRTTARTKVAVKPARTVESERAGRRLRTGSTAIRATRSNQRGHGGGQGPKTPTDHKLDDLEDFSRKMQRDEAKRRATGHAARSPTKTGSRRGGTLRPMAVRVLVVDKLAATRDSVAELLGERAEVAWAPRESAVAQLRAAANGGVAFDVVLLDAEPVADHDARAEPRHRWCARDPARRRQRPDRARRALWCLRRRLRGRSSRAS